MHPRSVVLENIGERAEKSKEKWHYKYVIVSVHFSVFYKSVIRECLPLEARIAITGVPSAD
jgi:hypothetical protein